MPVAVPFVSVSFDGKPEEIAYRDGSFVAPYLDSTRVGDTFSLKRLGGWPSAPTVRVEDVAASFLLPAYVPPLSTDTPPGLVYQPDHAGEAAGRLIAQFDDSAKLHALVRALVQPLQALEQDAFEVLGCFDVESAYGAQLDIVGGFVGVLRESKTDIAYRAYIKAKILANASDGTTETLLRISRLLLGEDLLSLTYVPGWVENHPAHFDLWVAASALRLPWDELATMSSEGVAVALADALFLATSAGVSFTLFYQYTADADTFVFSSVGDEEEDSVLQGLGDDDDEGVGGALIGAEERF